MTRREAYACSRQVEGADITTRQEYGESPVSLGVNPALDRPAPAAR